MSTPTVIAEENVGSGRQQESGEFDDSKSFALLTYTPVVLDNECLFDPMEWSFSKPEVVQMDGQIIESDGAWSETIDSRINSAKPALTKKVRDSFDVRRASVEELLADPDAGNPHLPDEHRDFFLSTYFMCLRRCEDDNVYWAMMNIAALDDFVVPKETHAIRGSVHANRPTDLPNLDDMWPSYKVREGDAQQFIFRVLTHKDWCASPGVPLAVSYPRVIRQFCAHFKGDAEDLFTAVSRSELQDLMTKAVVPMKGLFLDIIWYEICRLRKDRDELDSASLRLRNAMRLYEPSAKRLSRRQESERRRSGIIQLGSSPGVDVVSDLPVRKRLARSLKRLSGSAGVLLGMGATRSAIAGPAPPAVGE